MLVSLRLMRLTSVCTDIVFLLYTIHDFSVKSMSVSGVASSDKRGGGGGGGGLEEV